MSRDYGTEKMRHLSCNNKRQSNPWRAYLNVQNMFKTYCPCAPFSARWIQSPLAPVHHFLFKVHFHIILPAMLSLLTGNIPHNIILFNSKGLFGTHHLQDLPLSSARNWLYSHNNNPLSGGSSIHLKIQLWHTMVTRNSFTDWSVHRKYIQ